MQYRGKAFLLMPFHKSFDSLRGAIVEAGDAVGVRIERADDVFRAGIIIHQIKEKIQAADVVIAVCTRRKPNVFFELGIADQWHWPVLLAEKKADLPSDIEHYRALIYGGLDPCVFRAALRAFIEGTLNAGRKDQPRVDAAGPPPRSAPRALGQVMFQFHVIGLEREGLIEAFPVDVMFVIQDIRSRSDESQRAWADEFPKRKGVMADPSRVIEVAQESGLIRKDFDYDTKRSYLVLKPKAQELLRLYDDFLEQHSIKPGAPRL